MNRYDSYINSKFNWLGDLPTTWNLKKMKFCVEKHDELIESSDFLIAVENIESGSGRLIGLNKSPNYEGTITKFRKGDVLFNKLRPYLRKVYRAERDGGCFGELLILRGVEGQIDNGFLFYLTFSYSFIDIVDSSTHGTKMPRANWDNFIKHIKIPIPNWEEQTQIARYLDYKTAKIDALIEKKQRLIELLEEERIAIINQAVTKGLDPNVPMKDSGIEWLGEIPEHWTESKLKYISVMQSGDSITSEAINEVGQYPVYGGNGLRGYTSAFTNEGEFVLIGRQGALCGNIKYAEGKFWASEHAVVCYLNEKINWIWYGRLLGSMNLNQYNQSAAQPGLAVSLIKNLRIPLPPSQEQNEIAHYILRREREMDELDIKLGKEIELLKEYKTSLISEVVTGKVDVRNEVIPTDLL